MPPKLSKVSVYHHTHWDREWYAPMRSYQMRLAKVLDALQSILAPNGPLQNFTLDGQTVLLDDVLVLRPQLAPWLAEQIASKRLSIGPWFVMPDVVLVSGESLIRNLELGIKTAKAWGKTDAFTGYLPDPFGLPASIPKILNHVGITSAVLWRGVHPESPLSPIFWWHSADATQASLPTEDAGTQGGGLQPGNTPHVLTYHLAQGYFQNSYHDPTLSWAERQKALAGCLEKLSSQPFSKTIGILLPVGGDHLGPLEPAALQEMNQQLSRMSDHLETLTIDQWMASLETSLRHGGGDRFQFEQSAVVPCHRGELREATPGAPYLLSGVWSSRLYLKKENRKLEHLLTKRVEPLLCMAQYAQAAFKMPQAELDLAWRLLMLNHPHDSICGCSVDAVHQENEVRFAQVAQLADQLEKDALIQLASALQMPEDHLFFWHTGQAAVSGVIPFVFRAELPHALKNHPAIQISEQTETLIDNWPCDIQDVPQADRTRSEVCGWLWLDSAISLEPLKAQSRSISDLKAPNETQSVKIMPPNSESDFPALRNEYIRLNITHDGDLQVYDYQSKTTIRHLHTVSCAMERGDSYNPGLPQKIQSAQLIDVSVQEAGPLVGSLLLRYRLATQQAPLSTRICLKANSKMITFETSWLHQREDCRISVGFKVASAICEVVEESQFGVFRRRFPPTNTSSDPNPLEVEKGQEWQAPTGPIQRFIATQGQALFTEGLTEYWVDNHDLRLTLHRGFGMLSDDQTGTRGGHAGPPLKTPDGQCMNRSLSFRYAWQCFPQETLDQDPTALYVAADAFYGVTHAIGHPQILAKTTQKPSQESSFVLESLLKNLPSGVIVSAVIPHPEGWLIRLFNVAATSLPFESLCSSVPSNWLIRAMSASAEEPLPHQDLEPCALQRYLVSRCH
ncbi:MAG: glycoside hydrolase family 38 C-terminal domain-containing protein [Vampirovibrionales bacterium]|nr:glycoside hydrolase family 38 C-terminal domain-containing protein [Vampirovibrionales bacterium]